MRSAWNVRFAGFPPVRLAGAGMLALTRSARSVVVRSAEVVLAEIILSAIFGANFS